MIMPPNSKPMDLSSYTKSMGVLTAPSSTISSFTTPPSAPTTSRTNQYEKTEVNIIREYKNERNEMFYECTGCKFSGDLLSVFEHLKSPSHLRLFDDDSERHLCDICDVTFSSEDQFLQHLASEPHREALRRQSLTNKNKIQHSDISHVSEQLSKCSLQSSAVPKSDYYCSNCDEDLRTEDEFMCHLGSQKHRSRLKSKSSKDDDSISNSSQKDNNLKLYVDDDDDNWEIAVPQSSNSSPWPSASTKQIPRSQSAFITISTPNDSDSVCDVDAIKKLYDESNDWCHCCYIRYTSTAHKVSHLTGAAHQKKFTMKEVTMKSEQAPTFLCDVCFIVSNSAGQLELHLKSPTHLDTLKRRDEYFEATRNNNNNKLSPRQRLASPMTMPKSATISDIKMLCETSTKRQRKQETELDAKVSFQALESFNNRPIDESKIVSVFEYIDQSDENEEAKETLSNLDAEMNQLMEQNINKLKEISGEMLADAKKPLILAQKFLF